MQLTPEYVRGKTFNTMRLREGYAVDEVHTFLRRTGDAMAQLVEENRSLREASAAAPEASPEQDPAAASLRILAMAEETAQRVTAQALAEAEQLLLHTRAEAADAERETRERACALEADAERRYRAAMDSLESRQGEAQRRLSDLHAFEDEIRTRLSLYLRGQLTELEQAIPSRAPTTLPTMATVPTPAARPVAAPPAAARPAAVPPVAAPRRRDDEIIIFSPWKTEVQR
jgi:DivIVA domain-containing protein